MMYLQPAQYEAHGLPAETADGLVTMASALMDAHCRRPTLMAAQYVERVRLTAGAQTARLSYGPLAAGAVTSLRVRYGKPRRGEMELAGLTWQTEVATIFGLTGSWTAMDPATLDVDLAAREILFPANLLGLPYNEAEVTYTAGFSSVPDPVMAACAQIVRNAQAVPALNVKSSRLDTMQVEYWSGTLLDAGVLALLRPFVAEKLG